MLDHAEKLTPELQFVNPYEAPVAELEVPLAHENATDAEQIRKAHLKHEASLKSVGTLYYIAAGLLLLAFPSMILSVFTDTTGNELPFLILALALLALIMLLTFFLGRGLRKLAPWVKIPVTLFCIVGLTGIPVGTIFNAYILYLLHSKKGRTVLSADYREVIRQTPYIKYKSSRIVIAMFVLLLVALAWGVGAAVFMP